MTHCPLMVITHVTEDAAADEMAPHPTDAQQLTPLAHIKGYSSGFVSKSNQIPVIGPGGSRSGVSTFTAGSCTL